MKNRENRGRNVINIEEIKETLAHYSTKKHLSLPVDAWLQKSFLRWLINSFPYVQVVQSKECYRSLLVGDIPFWFQLDKPNVQYIYIEVAHREIGILLDRCTEFLESRDKRMVHKFPRMTVEQVLKKWEEEHTRMSERTLTYLETSTKALERLFSFDSFTFVRFRFDHKELSLEMARESALMQHCLGEFDDAVQGEGGYGEHYIKKIRKQAIELFSLRDSKNMPHATIALYKKDGEYWLEQIKGKQNRSPIERYVPTSVAFFNFLKVRYPQQHNDTFGMGVVYLQGKSRTIEDIEDETIQELLVASDASMIHKIKNPSKSTLWLATLRSPVEIAYLNHATDAMKITTLLQQTHLMLKVKFSLKSTAKRLLKNLDAYSIQGRSFIFTKLQVGRIE